MWWVAQTNNRVTPTWLLQDRSNKLQVILRFEAQLERMTVTPATSYCYCWFADLQDSSYKLHMNLRSKVPLARMSVTPAISYIGFFDTYTYFNSYSWFVIESQVWHVCIYYFRFLSALKILYYCTLATTLVRQEQFVTVGPSFRTSVLYILCFRLVTLLFLAIYNV